MKFTNEDAFEKLKGILTNNGRKTLRMSEKSLRSQLENLTPLIADDEMELDTFVEKVKPTFDVMNANAEYDKSSFIRKWKEEHPDTIIEKKEEDESNSNKVNQELLNRLAALEQQLKDEKTAKTLASVRKDLKAKMAEKGIKDDEWSEMMLGEIQISEDLDIEAKADTMLKLYNKQQAQQTPSFTPKPSSGDNNNNSPFASAVAEKKKRDEARKEII